MNRPALSIVVVILCGGCRHVENTPVAVVNLIREVDGAEKRPIGGFEIATREIDGQSQRGTVMHVPSMLPLGLPLPRHGLLRAGASIDPDSAPVPVRPRGVVIVNRIYEQLTD